MLSNSAGDDLGEEQDELEELLGAELEGAGRDASATPQPRATKKVRRLLLHRAGHSAGDERGGGLSVPHLRGKACLLVMLWLEYAIPLPS